jgi:hypothetical protein
MKGKETVENEHEATPLQPVLITLLKGVLYKERSPDLWRDLLSLQAAVRDYFTQIGLQLFIDESEGYAFLKQQQSDDEKNPLPRLIQRRQLSYPLSLLLVLLRKKLIELDSEGGQTRLILSREQMVEMIMIFLPESSNEAKLIDSIDRHINRLCEYGFLRRLKGEQSRYELHRIIKALVDGDWLSNFNDHLKEYHDHAAGTA